MSESPRADLAPSRDRAPAPAGEKLPRIGYLGPEGTFSEEALLAALAPGAAQPVALQTIYDTALALAEGEVSWAIVPIENSLDGSVTVTLDLLAEQAGTLTIVGEELLAVRHFLIAAERHPLEGITTVLTHPQVPGQCRRFLRTRLSSARFVPASSTADAVRIAAGAEPSQRTAAIGTRLAAELYNGTIICEDIQDRDDNLTKFFWLARACDPSGSADPPPLRDGARRGARKTSLVFWGPGADQAGWLVRCLGEFGARKINLTKIESRPRRVGMGDYMFFVDLEGDLAAADVAQALEGLRSLCEQVRILGSYPAAPTAVPAGGSR